MLVVLSLRKIIAGLVFGHLKYSVILYLYVFKLALALASLVVPGTLVSLKGSQ